jgi:hypothetical protein
MSGGSLSWRFAQDNLHGFAGIYEKMLVSFGPFSPSSPNEEQQLMASTAVTPQFARRANDDGTTDSICMNCFRTIATSVWESDLDRVESDHVCDPRELERFQRKTSV